MNANPELKVFEAAWHQLMSTPVHLDSLLSKQNPRFKSKLASVFPLILSRPVSLAQELGIGVPDGEPWSLSVEQRARWPVASQMAKALWALKTPEFIEIQKTQALEQDFPSELLSVWTKEWGAETTEHFIQSLTRVPPLTLRVNHSFTREQVIKELGQVTDNPWQVSPYSPLGVKLPRYASVLKHPLFEKGAYEIQDEGSQWISLFTLYSNLQDIPLTSQPGEIDKTMGDSKWLSQKFPPLTVIDACAGAGGKTLALSDILKGYGRVYAYDIYESKIAALKKRAKRSGLNNVQGVVLTRGQEAAEIQKFHKTADRVLVDAPCSGWGVLKRNPDTKWKYSDYSSQKFPELQKQLLEQYSELVKPGGRLVYSVCTFRKSETQELIERFSSDHPQFKILKQGYFGPSDTDGFYFGAWERVK